MIIKYEPTVRKKMTNSRIRLNNILRIVQLFEARTLAVQNLDRWRKSKLISNIEISD